MKCAELYRERYNRGNTARSRSPPYENVCPHMNQPPAIDFGNKILHVRYSRGRKIVELLMEKCRLELQGDRTFLVGNWLRSDSTAWNAGLAVAVAWDSVRDYLIYESVEEYRVRRKRFKDTHDETGERLPRK